jgi:hypothetical protein
MDETKSRGTRPSRPAGRKSKSRSTATTAAPAAPGKAPAAKRPVKGGAAPKPTAGAEREMMVRMAAYFQAERRGFAPGYEIEDWLAAEAEVTARTAPAPARNARKTAARKPKTG